MLVSAHCICSILGCPYTQDIGDGGYPSASGAGLFFAQEDNTAHFTIDVGRRKGDLRVDVRGKTILIIASLIIQMNGQQIFWICLTFLYTDIFIIWSCPNVKS